MNVLQVNTECDSNLTRHYQQIKIIHTFQVNVLFLILIQIFWQDYRSYP